MKDKVRVPDLVRMKAEGRKIVALTAYDYPFARIFDDAGVDLLLVGDSLGMVVQGHPTTLPVTLEQMIYHVQIVTRAVRRALVVGDMPFLSYQVSPEQAVHSAGRMIKEGGAEAVKLEGGVTVAQTVRRLVEAEIPVMGHVGLTPQAVHRMGGFKVQGRSERFGARSRQQLLDDALALEDAGAFALVLEGVPASLAAEITSKVYIPTIGIGAGAQCDGQVLVMHDMVGLCEESPPRFAKRYARLWDEISRAAKEYVSDVRLGRFPGPEHAYSD